jgi:hypothetical protein
MFRKSTETQYRTGSKKVFVQKKKVLTLMLNELSISRDTFCIDIKHNIVKQLIDCGIKIFIDFLLFITSSTFSRLLSQL